MHQPQYKKTKVSRSVRNYIDKILPDIELTDFADDINVIDAANYIQALTS